MTNSKAFTRYLPCAKVRTSHGVKGEFKIFWLSPNLEPLKDLTHGRLKLNNQERDVEIEQVRGSLPNLIMKIKGIDSPEAVRNIIGAEILRQVNPDKELAPGEFFAQDLIGLTVTYQGDTRGKVLSVWETSASDMLEIEKVDGITVHIPFLNQFVGEVNLDEKTMELVVDWVLE